MRSTKETTADKKKKEKEKDEKDKKKKEAATLKELGDPKLDPTGYKKSISRPQKEKLIQEKQDQTKLTNFFKIEVKTSYELNQIPDQDILIDNIEQLNINKKLKQTLVSIFEEIRSDYIITFMDQYIEEATPKYDENLDQLIDHVNIDIQKVYDRFKNANPKLVEWIGKQSLIDPSKKPQYDDDEERNDIISKLIEESTDKEFIQRLKDIFDDNIPRSGKSTRLIVTKCTQKSYIEILEYITKIIAGESLIFNNFMSNNNTKGFDTFMLSFTEDLKIEYKIRSGDSIETVLIDNPCVNMFNEVVFQFLPKDANVYFSFFEYIEENHEIIQEYTDDIPTVTMFDEVIFEFIPEKEEDVERKLENLCKFTEIGTIKISALFKKYKEEQNDIIQTNLEQYIQLLYDGDVAGFKKFILSSIDDSNYYKTLLIHIIETLNDDDLIIFFEQYYSSREDLNLSWNKYKEHNRHIIPIDIEKYKKEQNDIIVDNVDKYMQQLLYDGNITNFKEVVLSSIDEGNYYKTLLTQIIKTLDDKNLVIFFKEYVLNRKDLTLVWNKYKEHTTHIIPIEIDPIGTRTKGRIGKLLERGGSVQEHTSKYSNPSKEQEEKCSKSFNEKETKYLWWVKEYVNTLYNNKYDINSINVTGPYIRENDDIKIYYDINKYILDDGDNWYKATFNFLRFLCKSYKSQDNNDLTINDGKKEHIFQIGYNVTLPVKGIAGEVFFLVQDEDLFQLEREYQSKLETKAQIKRKSDEIIHKNIENMDLSCVLQSSISSDCEKPLKVVNMACTFLSKRLLAIAPLVYNYRFDTWKGKKSEYITEAIRTILLELPEKTTRHLFMKIVDITSYLNVIKLADNKDSRYRQNIKHLHYLPQSLGDIKPENKLLEIEQGSAEYTEILTIIDRIKIREYRELMRELDKVISLDEGERRITSSRLVYTQTETATPIKELEHCDTLFPSSDLRIYYEEKCYSIKELFQIIETVKQNNESMDVNQLIHNIPIPGYAARQMRELEERRKVVDGMAEGGEKETAKRALERKAEALALRGGYVEEVGGEDDKYFDSNFIETIMKTYKNPNSGEKIEDYVIEQEDTSGENGLIYLIIKCVKKLKEEQKEEKEEKEEDDFSPTTIKEDNLSSDSSSDSSSESDNESNEKTDINDSFSPISTDVSSPKTCSTCGTKLDHTNEIGTGFPDGQIRKYCSFGCFPDDGYSKITKRKGASERNKKLTDDNIVITEEISSESESESESE